MYQLLEVTLELKMLATQDTVDFGKFSSAPVDRLFSTAGHWTEQSATPQPSE